MTDECMRMNYTQKGNSLRESRDVITWHKMSIGFKETSFQTVLGSSSVVYLNFDIS